MTKPSHYFGISGFFNRNIFKSWNNVHPYLFYDIQATYSATRNRFFTPFSNDINGDVLYKEYIEFRGPFTWVEQNISVGFKTNLFGDFYLNQKVGFGSAFILGYDKTLLDKQFNWFAWNFSTLFSVGIEYRFEKKKD